ncbi:MAG: DUF1573 domain-containing protein [Planctomycetes bacterium]|nr:DUF1573 domain-containing protein [Planctomycetota bacterium]
MRMKLLPIFLAIILSLSTHERRATSDERPTLGRPGIFFETNKFDFGKICEKEKVEYIFKYKNRGSSKLVIHEVKTTCDCTAANANLTELEPGESGEIMVTYTASNKTGKFEKAVIVISNDPNTSHYVLLISGEVVREVIADPEYIDFGLIPTGERSSKSVKLSKGYGNRSLSASGGWITGIECDSPLVTASYKENGNDEYIIEATLKSPPKVEQTSQQIQGNIFVLTKGLKQSRIELPFFGKVSGDVSDTALTIMFTGEEAGYLEPCGCSEDQLGGIPRRHTFIKSQIPNPKPQNALLVSLGDLTDGFGRQSEIKMEITVQALEMMGYFAHNLGEKDIAMGPELLNYLPMVSRLKFLSSNVKFTDGLTNRIHPFLIKHVRGKDFSIKIGFLGILSSSAAATMPSYGFKITEPVSSLRPLIGVLKGRVDVLVLLSHAEWDESIRLAEMFPELDLVISGHDIDDPAAYEPVHVKTRTEQGERNTTVVSAGSKGKYAGTYRYSPYEKKGSVEIIPLSSIYTDSPEMRELIKQYLQIVKEENLLAYEPKMPVPSNDTFVGSKTCSICHKEVYKHWETTTHASAYETLIKSEHNYDPDCIPCHVTGFQYTSGFESIEKTPALKGVGCEDCHGPGSAHINAPLEEYGKTTSDACATCHIPDHSPKFEFISYWKKITHPEERISALGG